MRPKQAEIFVLGGKIKAGLQRFHIKFAHKLFYGVASSTPS